MTWPVADAVAAGLLTFGTAIWVGGIVTLVLVSRVAGRTLEPAAKVALFQVLGRDYAVVSISALVIALASGAVLVRGRSWTPLLTSIAVTAAVLLAATAGGIVQARAMSRRRQAAAADPGNVVPADGIVRGAGTAAFIRTLIGVLTVALVSLGLAVAR